jgi:hypothetical protein
MPIRILELGKQFRQATSIVYPPFKNGRYMEEYFYDYVMAHKNTIETDLVYIPVFWTNIQIHPNFQGIKEMYNVLLKRAYSQLPEDTKYFTIVQADLGVELTLPRNTLVFGACYGDIPLPLIYEDIEHKLSTTPRNTSKKYLASFVGTYNTHQLRTKIFTLLNTKPNFKFEVNTVWTNKVPTSSSEAFINTTLQSKFCLAPRGFGRSSFRFFEAMLLGVIPVYFWDDIEWLPYKDKIDYSKFTVSIHDNNINRTSEVLKSITNEQYNNMVNEMNRVSHYFTLEGMSEYILEYISTKKYTE